MPASLHLLLTALESSRLSPASLTPNVLQEFAAYRHEERLVICTGSATGAYSSAGPPTPTPSFALMDIDGGKVRRGSCSLTCWMCWMCCA